MDFVEVSQRPECRCIPRTSLFIGRRMFFSIYRLSHGRHPNTQHPAVRQCISCHARCSHARRALPRRRRARCATPRVRGRRSSRWIGFFASKRLDHLTLTVKRLEVVGQR